MKPFLENDAGVFDIKNPDRAGLETADKDVLCRVDGDNHAEIVLRVGEFIQLLESLGLPDSDREIYLIKRTVGQGDD